MLPLELSAILSTFIKLPFVIKTFVLSIFEWPFYTGFTLLIELASIKGSDKTEHLQSFARVFAAHRYKELIKGDSSS